MKNNTKMISILIEILLGTIASVPALLNYLQGEDSLILTVGVTALIFSVILVIRMVTQKRRLFFMSYFIFAHFILVAVLRNGKESIGIVAMGLLIGFLISLFLEAMLCVCNIPKLAVKKFSSKQMLVAAVAAVFNIMTLKMSSVMSNRMFAVGIFVFFGTMTTIFAAKLINQIFGLSLITFMFTLFALPLGKNTIYYEFFSTQSKVEIIVISLGTIVFTECVINILSIKNVRALFKPVRYGHVDSLYLKKIKGIPYAFLFALIVPVALNVAVYENFNGGFASRMLFGFVLALFGGLMASLFSGNIEEWRLYTKIHGGYREEWFREFDKWLTCCAIADIDGDGKNELITGCADNYVYCFKDDKILWKVNVNNVPSPTCGIGTLGNQPEIKIVVGSYDGKVRCLDSNGQILWENQTPSWIWSVALGDVDNDGENEVVYGGMDNFIHVCKDGGEEMWSTEFDNWIGCIAIGDIDNDGKNEVIAGSSDNTLRCYKNGPNEVWRAHFGEWVNACAIGDVDGDGLNEVVAGGFDGTIRCYKNGEEIWRMSIFGSVGAMVIGDLDGDGENEILVGCGDHTIRVLKNGNQVWMARVEKYADGAAIGDIDNDGKLEFITGDWYCYLRCFKFNF